jgi:hypothetical protein
MKRSLFLLVILAVNITLAQAAPKPGSPQALIIGKWWSQAAEGRVTVEYKRDGTFTSTYKGQTTPGKYRWLDDKNILLNDSQKVGIEVSANTLIMVIGAERSKFERVKAPATK